MLKNWSGITPQMSDHSRLSLEKALKEEKGLGRITNLHLQMMLNVIAIALQKVMEIPGVRTVPPKGKDRWYHNVISAVDQNVNPVATTCITPTTIDETSIMDDVGQDSTHSDEREDNFFSQTQEYNFFQSSSKEKATDGNKRSWDEQNSSSFDWEDEQHQNKRHQTESDQSPHNSEEDEDDYNGSSSPYVEKYNGYDSQESDQDY
jgi:hypothetical protein